LRSLTANGLSTIAFHRAVVALSCHHSHAEIFRLHKKSGAKEINGSPKDAYYKGRKHGTISHAA
jgi:hypothetical protein